MCLEAVRQAKDGLQRKQAEAAFEEFLHPRSQTQFGNEGGFGNDGDTAEAQSQQPCGDYDRLRTLAAQKRWKTGDTVRSLPFLEVFASPTRIQQTTHDDLPLDFSFRQVTRIDRCTTCHLGIDRPDYDKNILIGLRVSDERLQANLDTFRQLLAMLPAGKRGSFDLDELPQEVPTVAGSILTDSRCRRIRLASSARPLRG